MSVELAGVVVASISALSSVVQAYKAALDVGKSISETKLDQIFKDATSTPRAAETVSKLLDDDTLKDLLENIDDDKTRLRRTIKDRTLPKPEVKRILDEIDRDICFQLEIMKRYNDGVLPDVEGLDLYELAVTHGCD